MKTTKETRFFWWRR